MVCLLILCAEHAAGRDGASLAHVKVREKTAWLGLPRRCTLQRLKSALFSVKSV
jgi:hypothetical protein